MSNEVSIVESINKEVSFQLANEGSVRALLATTFKDFDEKLMRQAITEGMIRGFTFKSFLEKDVYPIKYGTGYQLVTSISHARKLGMSGGIVGKEEPRYTFDEKGNVESCTVVVKRKFGDYVGDFAATVYMKEYNTGKNLWQSKPMTMLAKVAEMHALRSACPEALAEAFVEEEYAVASTARAKGGDSNTVAYDKERARIIKHIESVQTVDDLSAVAHLVETYGLEESYKAKEEELTNV